MLTKEWIEQSAVCPFTVRLKKHENKKVVSLLFREAKHSENEVSQNVQDAFVQSCQLRNNRST